MIQPQDLRLELARDHRYTDCAPLGELAAPLPQAKASPRRQHCATEGASALRPVSGWVGGFNLGCIGRLAQRDRMVQHAALKRAAWRSLMRHFLLLTGTPSALPGGVASRPATCALVA